MTTQEATIEEATIEVGSRWFIWGRHYEVRELGERDGEPHALLVPLERPDRPHPFDWVSVRRIERYGLPSGA